MTFEKFQSTVYGMAEDYPVLSEERDGLNMLAALNPGWALKVAGDLVLHDRREAGMAIAAATLRLADAESKDDFTEVVNLLRPLTNP